MRQENIFVARPSLPLIDEYINEIKDLWDSPLLTNMGIKHQRFESELVHYLGARNLTLFVNGHLALENAIAAFELTGEVITTPFTFASTTHAIVRSGLIPVFCDIDPDDFTMDTTKIESLITEKTSAIIPVHIYGYPCKVHEIERIAKKNCLKVIYDAAHAFGVTLNGIGIANFGDASMFSFHAAKVFNSIEGGAVAFADANLKKQLDYQKNYGFAGPECVEFVGGNAKMNEFQAAMGLCNLRHIDDEISKRKIVFEKYAERLVGVDGIRLFCSKKGVRVNYSYFPVIFDGYKYDRDEIFEKLKLENIFTRKYFYPLTNCFECYRGRFDPKATPVAEYISERVLTLPLYADLSLNDVDRICNNILR